MSANHDPLPGDLREDLVAYLDGELDGASSRRMDELLAVDPRVQAEVHRLQTAWELLDDLPRTEVDDSFSRTTVTMVAQAISADIEAEAAVRPRRVRRQWLAVGGGLAAAALAGFLAARLLLPQENAELLRDLRVYQDLDPYRQAGDIEFLRLLNDESVFPAEAVDAS
jgi:anti-sigma factor RsiW